MAASKPSLVVLQKPDWDAVVEPGQQMPHAYVIKSAKNTTVHAIGETLSRAQVDDLIRIGVDISIVGS